jgi:peptide/nickel transport system permease protein
VRDDKQDLPMKVRIRRVALGLATRICAVLLVGGIAAIMVRLGPGFSADERDLDPTFSASSRAAMHAARAPEQNILLYLVNFVRGAVNGDLGKSRALEVSVSDLIAQRGPVTARILLLGAGEGWLVGLTWAAAATLLRRRAVTAISSYANLCVLCVPIAAIAALGWTARWPAEIVLALALLPRIFQVTRTLMTAALSRPDVLAARSRGIGSARIFVWHIMPGILGPMLAWMAATIAMAIGAMVPIEVVLDVPGLGQLAWKAALARDLPVLLALTALVAAIVQLSNWATTGAGDKLRGQPV